MLNLIKQSNNAILIINVNTYILGMAFEQERKHGTIETIQKNSD